MDVEASVAQLREMIEAGDLPHDDELLALTTIPEVLGYMIAVAGQEGWDEVEYSEVLARSLDMTASKVREIERVLRPLGYDAVATMLRRVARRSRRK